LLAKKFDEVETVKLESSVGGYVVRATFQPRPVTRSSWLTEGVTLPVWMVLALLVAPFSLSNALEVATPLKAATQIDAKLLVPV
jgi:hypothetical protein